MPDSELSEMDTRLDIGTWFKSAETGVLYRNRSNAGEIDCVRIDGEWYDKAEKPKYDEAELDELIEKGTKAWAGVSVDELRA